MKALYYVGFLLGSAACLPVPVFAEDGQSATPPQPNERVDGDIIVTAQRREQSILKVPLAITAASGDQLESKGITNSNQLSNTVPSLQINSAYGDSQPNFTLRGIGVANEYNSNQASPVGVYVNDVYLASRTAQGMGLYDLDRVEVLRGPQGTLFGRNTTGGAINFITKTPTLSGNNGYAQAGYGNFDTWSAQGAIETTMVEDQLGVRIAGHYEKGDGKIKNVFPGQPDPNSVDTLSGRATIRIKPDETGLDVKITAYAGRNRGTQEAVIGPASAKAGLGFFQVNENHIGLNKSSGAGVSANIAYEISSALKFISITSYDASKQAFVNGSDGSPDDFLDTVFASKYRQFTTENRLNYSGDSLNLVTGIFYGHDTIETDNSFDIGGALGPGVNGGFFQHYKQTRKSYAAFAQSDYNITDSLVMTIGLRYTADRGRYDDGYAYLYASNVGGPRTPLATTVPCPGAPGTCAYDPSLRYAIKGRNNALTGRAALSYTFDSGLLLYASYNRGYRSGAFNGGGYTSAAGITYIRPEQVNAYEAGMKGRFLDNRLTVSAAGFYYDYKNQQVQDLRPGPIGFLVNAPKSQAYGGELETVFRIMPGLNINATVGYLRTKYKELTLQGTDLSGNELPFAPKLTLQGGFDLTLARIADGDIVLSPNVSYYSKQYYSPYNNINAIGTTQMNSELQQGSFAKVNAALAWNHDTVTLRAWVNNLTNEKTYSYALDLRGAGFPFNYLVPAAPRTYGGSVKVSF